MNLDQVEWVSQQLLLVPLIFTINPNQVECGFRFLVSRVRPLNYISQTHNSISCDKSIIISAKHPQKLLCGPRLGFYNEASRV